MCAVLSAKAYTAVVSCAVSCRVGLKMIAEKWKGVMECLGSNKNHCRGNTCTWGGDLARQALSNTRDQLLSLFRFQHNTFQQIGQISAQDILSYALQCSWFKNWTNGNQSQNTVLRNCTAHGPKRLLRKGGHSKNHKRQRRKRQSVTAKRGKSQTPKYE